MEDNLQTDSELEDGRGEVRKSYVSICESARDYTNTQVGIQEERRQIVMQSLKPLSTGSGRPR